jgi:Uri superfamily endonuclease
VLCLLFNALFFCQSDVNITASFDRRGRYIYTGNAKGKVYNLLERHISINFNSG